MGSQSTTVAKQSSSSRSSQSARNAPPRAASLQFAEDHNFVSPGSGLLPHSIAQIAADAPAEPAPLHVGPLNLPLQRKLAIGETHDPLEAEADSMADRVLRMTDPTAPVASSSAPPILQRKCSCEGSGSQCKECEEAERGKKLHRKAASTAASHEAPPVVHDVLSSPGHPLDTATRAFFEPRFGYDFSSVRVHADTHASESAHSVNALAYTVGHNLVFGSGRYTPSTPVGRRLLAHELSHVVQQKGDTIQRSPEDEASSPEQMRLPPKGINPEVDLPRTPMEEAKLSCAVSHKVITFILGPDGDPFYKAAHEYWKQPGRTDILVTSQRTLTGVLDYLKDQKHAPPNGRSWGQLNLVTHANEEGGMGFKLSSESQSNISPEELDQKIKAGAIPKVDDSVIDRSTAINVHGCAIGRNPQMLKELSQAISGDKSDVYAPKDLQAYKYSGRGKSEKTEEYLVEYWAVGFPEGQAHSRKQLITEFNEEFGAGPGIDWSKAIAGAHTKTMPFHFEFTFPFTRIPAKSDRRGHAGLLRRFPESASWTRWSVASQSTAPDGQGNEVTTVTYNVRTTDDAGQPFDTTFDATFTNLIVPRKKEDQIQFMRDQIGTDKADRFSWTFTFSSLPAPGLSGEVKISVEGKRTIIRIERELKDPSGAHQHPSRENPEHYGSYKPD
jgi:hypothetical protein